MPTDERVLVIPTAVIRDLGYFFGFWPVADSPRLAALLNPDHFRFRPRPWPNRWARRASEARHCARSATWRHPHD